MPIGKSHMPGLTPFLVVVVVVVVLVTNVLQGRLNSFRNASSSFAHVLWILLHPCGGHQRLIQVTGTTGTTDNGMNRSSFRIMLLVLPQPRTAVGHGFHIGQTQITEFVGGSIQPSTLIVGTNNEESHVVLLCGQSNIFQITSVHTISRTSVRSTKVIVNVAILKGVGFNGAFYKIGTSMRGKANVPNDSLFFQFHESLIEIALVLSLFIWSTIFKQMFQVVIHIESMNRKQVHIVQLQSLNLFDNQLFVLGNGHTTGHTSFGLNNQILSFANTTVKHFFECRTELQFRRSIPLGRFNVSHASRYGML
mmetsp:Transcript_7204/g.10949  ORF Transcript_7204/g.10949 Transcript_7204/m.10949 type:complete len:308 (-) Transcript_7204:180-1103(-)